MKIILINGAPGSGKDTLAQLLTGYFEIDTTIEKFAKPLKVGVPAIYGMSQQEWDDHYDTPEHKDLKASRLFDKTPREAQIALSETFLKPLHGKGVFGEMLVERIKASNQKWFLVTDSGFVEEAEVVVDAFGAENVQLWTIKREGRDFSNDSRNYVDLSHRGVEHHEIENNDSLYDLFTKGTALFKKFTGV